MMPSLQVATLKVPVFVLFCILVLVYVFSRGAVAPPHGGPDYFIKPSLQSACLGNNASEDRCMTLNDFAKLAKLTHDGSQPFQHDVRLIFIGGKHSLTQELNFSGVENVQIISANSLNKVYNDSEVHIEVAHTDLIFNSVGRLTIENIEIIGATIILENAPKRHADIRGVHLLKSTLLHRYRSTESEALTSPDNDNELRYSNTTAPPHTNIRIESSIIEKQASKSWTIDYMEI